MSLVIVRKKTLVKWKRIPGFEKYKVSSAGHVIKDGYGFLFVLTKKSGYDFVKVYRRVLGVTRFHRYDVHRLVWNLFGSEPHKKGYSIHHIDGDKKNNRIENLVLMKHIDHIRLHKSKKISYDTENR